MQSREPCQLNGCGDMTPSFIGDGVSPFFCASDIHQKLGEGLKEGARPVSGHSEYRRTRGIGLTGLSPFCEKIVSTYKTNTFISILFLREESSWQR